MEHTYDFSGWATKNNLKCADGRVILRDAFKDNDGQTVPLVWNHQHDDSFNVLGHALLENRAEGVYAYCTLNDTAAGRNAKELVKNGDVTALSIYANKLKQHGSSVLHGAIREVSLVLAGANPEAVIDTVLAHSGEYGDEEECYLTMGEYSDVTIAHSAMEEDEQEDEDKELSHADEDSDEKEEDDDVAEEKTVKDVFDTLTDEQKNAVYAIVGMAVEEAKGDDVEHSAFEGGEEMKHNVFDIDTQDQDDELMHTAMDTIIADGKRFGSMKESFLAHADEYGITNIDYLFPDARTMNNAPEFIKRPDDWVSKVMNGVHHTPFSRIKSVFADITEDEARAKGYIKGKMKKEEVFSLLKRTTTPTTIYKKQKLDRDDVIDITDFDVVAWLKTEMRMMLNEEIARAILVGDGRLASDDDKINESNIRPIVSDDDLYTIKKEVTPATGEQLAHAFITENLKARKDYRGSGSPVMFITEDMLSDCLLLEDSIGHRLYKSETELATALRVKELIPVPVFPQNIYAIVVNLTDYNVGADKGGSVNMFDDFDIDYNQQKYLIETRCSGALTKPYSAIVLKAHTEG